MQAVYFCATDMRTLARARARGRIDRSVDRRKVPLSLIGGLESPCDRRTEVARGKLRGGGVPVGEGSVFGAVRNDWLAEAQPGLTELAELLGGQLGMALPHELEGVIHPFDLVIALGSENTTLPYRAEQLVACAVHQRLRGRRAAGSVTVLSGALLPRQRLPPFTRFSYHVALREPQPVPRASRLANSPII